MISGAKLARDADNVGVVAIAYLRADSGFGLPTSGRGISNMRLSVCGPMNSLGDKMPVELTDNEVRVFHCESWDAFTKEAKKTRVLVSSDGSLRSARTVLFRGHARQDWRLSSTLERSLLLEGTAFQLRQLNGTDWYSRECNNILQKFTANATGLPGFRETASELDRWIMGRHHGLLSPYLDWTTSPFVAAFFALEEVYRKFSGLRSHYPMQFKDVVHVWGLRLWDDISEPEIFEVEQSTTVHGTRPRAQRTALTILRSKDHVDLEGYLRSRGLAYFLERYDIELVGALDALKELELMNINYLSLFPDIEGAVLVCQHAEALDRATRPACRSHWL